MTPPDEELLAQLKSLAPPAADELTIERVRRRGREALAREVALARRPWLIPVERIWSRAVVPALVTSAVGAYLLWAVRAAAALYQ